MRFYLVVPSICLIWIAVSVVSAVTVRADEGMWVFNNLPLAHLKARHGY